MKGSLGIALFSLLGTLSSTVHGSVLPRDAKPKPVIPGNFADPSIIQVDNKWYAFATNDRAEAKNHGGPNVQISTSPDAKKWTKPDGKTDALPDPGCWVNKGPLGTDGADVWAPHVVQLPNPHKFRENQFVMYYAAKEAKGLHRHCIGAAVSTKIEGPYLARAEPLVCDSDKGGAIDPAGFQDSDGKLYITYKIDGNAIGHGGTCNNMKDPIVPTPIMLQGLRDDGITPEGAPRQLLDRDAGDGPLIEAPSLVQSDHIYYLFFSSQCVTDTNYDTSYATSKNLCGPYVKTSQPLIVAGGGLGLVGPGSAMATPDGKQMVFHAQVDQKRSMFIGDLTLKNGVATIKVNSG